MRLVVLYQILIASIVVGIGILLSYEILSVPSNFIKLLIYCASIGGIGGVMYCLRGVYLNACVHKRWDSAWLPWYFIRPIVSMISGAISCLFLSTGLIIFEAQQVSAPSNFAFFSLAFIAGLNVDRFVEKLETIAEVTWGIKRSRASQNNSTE